MSLPATVQAEGIARRAIQERWPNLGTGVMDDLLVVVSELVSNAVQHGEPSIRLYVRADPFAVDVSVLDHGPAMPEITSEVPDTAEPDIGRGLHLVDRLADRWGFDPSPARPGKAVWATLSTVESAGPTAGHTEGDHAGRADLVWAGEVDLAVAASLRDEALRVVADAPGARVTLDLSGVNFLDSAGLNVMLTVRQAAMDAGKTLVVLDASRPVTHLLQVTGLDEVFPLGG